jgi:hypothetical protein
MRWRIEIVLIVSALLCSIIIINGAAY